VVHFKLPYCLARDLKQVPPGCQHHKSPGDDGTTNGASLKNSNNFFIYCYFIDLTLNCSWLHS
jgi:hypothetical protein